MKKISKYVIAIILSISCISNLQAQEYSYRIALLKYSGGGDWYANPTSLPNLIAFCNDNLGTNINPEPVTVEAGSS
ncbi:MAG: DUF4159 domain-containing protein, partial [Bacteroidales bacterium]|nr:DUF4159 domain-containing protein [Bacteroidales bacterium]